jgi:sugar phosphate isomerase/epimerase
MNSRQQNFATHEPRSAGLRPASSAGVSPVGAAGGGTPPELAAEDGCVTRSTPRPSLSRVAEARPALSRRQFFSSAAGAAVGALALPSFSGVAAVLAPWKMRLATSSVMFADLVIEQVCERVAGLGFEAIDIWCPFDKCRHLEDVDQRLGADGLKALLAKTKLNLCAFSVYNGGLTRYAKLVRNFGGGVVVRESQYGKLKPEELRGQMKNFFEKLKPQIELAAECKAQLAIENHGDALLDTPDSFKAFVDLNPAPKQVGIALAPYHLQGRKASVEEVIATCGSQLLFFYAWQNAPDLKQLPGHGPTDFTPWLKALAKINYANYVTPFMHGHPPTEEMAAAVAKSRDYLKTCYAQAVGG